MRTSCIASILWAGLLLFALPGLAMAQPAGLRQFFEKRGVELSLQSLKEGLESAGWRVK